MAYGNYWKAVTPEDKIKIERWLDQHETNTVVDIEAVDVASLLFDKKYGVEIKLAIPFEVTLSFDETTGEQYYIDEEGKAIYGEWESNSFKAYRYLDEEAHSSTIEYISVANEEVLHLANDLAQNHWNYALNLKPNYEGISLEEYLEDLANAGYL